MSRESHQVRTATWARAWFGLTGLVVGLASPLMCTAGWLVFGPRGRVTWRVVWLSLIFPICWLVFTLVRGPIVRFYPYPFLDVDEHGYLRVLVNCVVVAILFVGLGALTRVTDRRLDR